MLVRQPEFGMPARIGAAVDDGGQRVAHDQIERVDLGMLQLGGTGRDRPAAEIAGLEGVGGKGGPPGADPLACRHDGVADAACATATVGGVRHEGSLCKSCKYILR